MTRDEIFRWRHESHARYILAREEQDRAAIARLRRRRPKDKTTMLLCDEVERKMDADLRMISMLGMDPSFIPMGA